MHLTRPKSSKGRSRPALNTDGIQRPPATPESPVFSRPDRNFRTQAQPIVWQASHLDQDDILHMLQHTPAAPPQSLNKYKVLPSIERRQSEVSPRRDLEKNMSKLNLSDDDTVLQRRRHVETDPPTAQISSSEGHLRLWPKPPDPGSKGSKEAGDSGSLLLAIRGPCGRRFQQHFERTDTLLMVRASAEARFGAAYGDACIETMDVPRRSFTDMDMTLAQCGILNRSVLCISQRKHSMLEHETA